MKTFHLVAISFFLIFLLSGTLFLKQYANADYPTPLQQVRQGIPITLIKCNDGFVKIFTKAGSPACVRLETAVNLVDRGSWLSTIKTVWFIHYSSEATPWLSNIPSDIALNHTEQCVMAGSTWSYLQSQGVNPLEILWTWPNLIATPEGVVDPHPIAGFLVHVLPNESSIMNKLGFKERSDVYYPLDLSLTPRLSVCNDSGKTRSLANSIGSENHLSNTTQTLTIGTDTYDVKEFQPIPGNSVNLDDMKFVYENRSSLSDSCYPEIVNQTQARDIEIVSNEADMHAHFCWPPTNYPQNMTRQNALPSDLFSKYSIGFFDNQTMGVGWCHLDSCEFGKMFFLVKRGWNEPIVFDSASSLEFHMITNASTISNGQSIGINMSTINKSPNPILVQNQYNFSFTGTGLGPCYYGPFRLAILDGYYDENNFTQGTELKMYSPGIYSCPAPEPVKGYKFEPSSDTAKPRCSPLDHCEWTEHMQEIRSFSGYWNDTSFHYFENGMYTIITGDEWESHSIKHFAVK